MKHTHQYKKVKQKPSNRVVWRCMIVNCSHYTTPEFILGKRSVCPSCEQEFIIDKVASDRTFPTCEDCRGELRNPNRAERGRFAKKSEASFQTSSPQLSKVSADIMKKFGIG